MQPSTTSHNRDLALSHKSAESGGPIDYSVGGEEDPGAGLESLVEVLGKGPETMQTDSLTADIITSEID